MLKNVHQYASLSDDQMRADNLEAELIADDSYSKFTNKNFSFCTKKSRFSFLAHPNKEGYQLIYSKNDTTIKKLEFDERFQPSHWINKRLWLSSYQQKPASIVTIVVIDLQSFSVVNKIVIDRMKEGFLSILDLHVKENVLTCFYRSKGVWMEKYDMSTGNLTFQSKPYSKDEYPLLAWQQRSLIAIKSSKGKQEIVKHDFYADSSTVVLDLGAVGDIQGVRFDTLDKYLLIYCNVRVDDAVTDDENGDSEEDDGTCICHHHFFLYDSTKNQIVSSRKITANFRQLTHEFEEDADGRTHVNWKNHRLIYLGFEYKEKKAGKADFLFIGQIKGGLVIAGFSAPLQRGCYYSYLRKSAGGDHSMYFYFPQNDDESEELDPDFRLRKLTLGEKKLRASSLQPISSRPC